LYDVYANKLQGHSKLRKAYKVSLAESKTVESIKVQQIIRTVARPVKPPKKSTK
jgi:hypothetical protein